MYFHILFLIANYHLWWEKVVYGDILFRTIPPYKPFCMFKKYWFLFQKNSPDLLHFNKSVSHLSHLGNQAPVHHYEELSGLE